jgi:hypothetical protein
MDMHFISDNLLIIFACPITTADLTRRSLDDEEFPIAPKEGKMKLHIYYVGPNQNGISSPCLLRTLLFPRFNNRWRADIDTGKIVPQTSDISSKPGNEEPLISDGLPFRGRNESGVVCLTISGLLVRQAQANSSHQDNGDEDYSMGIGWVVDIVLLKRFLLTLAEKVMSLDDKEKANAGGEVHWASWIGDSGENVRLFPHSDEGWLGSPKVYEACSYRVASVTPLKRGEHGNEVFNSPDITPESEEVRRKVTKADRRLDVLDFCPGRIDGTSFSTRVLVFNTHRLF